MCQVHVHHQTRLYVQSSLVHLLFEQVWVSSQVNEFWLQMNCSYYE